MASDLVPERTDVWTDVKVPANGFTIRGVFPRGAGAEFDIDELTGIVREFLAARGVATDHIEGFLLNRSKAVPSSAASGPRDFSAEVGSHFAGPPEDGTVMAAGTLRFPSVPAADDPELAGHALWNDEIAADLEAQVQLFEDSSRLAGFRECPCGLLSLRAGYRCPCGEIAGGRPRDFPARLAEGE